MIVDHTPVYLPRDAGKKLHDFRVNISNNGRKKGKKVYL